MKIAAIGGFVARTTFAHLAILSSPLSASAAQSVPPSDPDLVYAVVDGQPLRNNLHRANPAPALPTPLVLWRHGGGWQSGGRTRMPSFALPLLQADISVATLD